MRGDEFRCLNCSSEDRTPVYAGCPDYYLGTPFRVDYVRCSRCGLVQQSPVPEDVAPFYEDYPIHKEKGPIHRLARRVLIGRLYCDASGLPAGGVLVDYGAGDGSYLESLKGRGLDLVGFEPDARHATDLSERLGSAVYSDADALGTEYAGRVDMVTAHFVMEHVTDLSGTVSRLSALLKPGGRLCVLVPNISSWEARLFGRRWHWLDPPRHISFPSESVMREQGRRCGLTLDPATYVRSPGSVAGSLATVLLGRFWYPLYVGLLPIGIVATWLAPSGTMMLVLTRDA